MIEVKLFFEPGEEIVLARTVEFLDKLRAERAGRAVPPTVAAEPQGTHSEADVQDDGSSERKPRRVRPSRSKAAIAEREAAKRAEDREDPRPHQKGDITLDDVRAKIDEASDLDDNHAIEIVNYYKSEGIKNTTSLKDDHEALAKVYNFVCGLIDGCA